MEVGNISVGVTGDARPLKEVLNDAKRESEKAGQAIKQNLETAGAAGAKAFTENVGKTKTALKEMKEESERVAAAVKQSMQFGAGPGGRGISDPFSSYKAGAVDLMGVMGKLGVAISVAALASKGFQFQKESLEVGAKYEHTMLQVKAVTEATQEEFKALDDVARRLGATTEFTAQQAAEGLKILGQAGVNARNSVAALPGILDLATIGEMSLAEATNTAVAAVNSFRLAMDDMGRVNDVIAKTAIATNVDVKDMAESFKYAAPAAAAFGYSIEELSGYIGLLGNLGIKGSMAGTQLAFAMEKSLEVFKKLGMSGEGKKLIDALEIINTKGWTTAQVLDVFGERGGRAVLGLQTLTGEYQNFVKELENAEGASQRMAEVIRSSTLGLFRELQSTVESVQIDIFTANKDNIQQAIKDITETIRLMKPAIVEVSTGFAQFLKLLEEYGPTGLVRKNEKAAKSLTDLYTQAMAVARDLIRGQEQLNKDMEEYDNQLRRIQKTYKDFDLAQEHIANMDQALRNAAGSWKGLIESSRWQLGVGLDPKAESNIKKLGEMIDSVFAGDAEQQDKMKKYLQFRLSPFGVGEKEVRESYNKAVEMIKAAYPKEKHEEMIRWLESQFNTKFDIDFQPKPKKEEFPLHELDKMAAGWRKEIENWKTKEALTETILVGVNFDFSDENAENLRAQLVEADKGMFEAVRRYQEGDVKRLDDIRKKAKEAYGELAEGVKNTEGVMTGATDIFQRHRDMIATPDPETVRENKRMIEQQVEWWEEGYADIKKLTQKTFDNMQQTASDFYFKAMQGDIKNLEDLWKSFYTSLQRMAADYLGQLTAEGMFGKGGQGGGLLQQLAGTIGGVIGGAMGGGDTSEAAIEAADTSDDLNRQRMSNWQARQQHSGGDWSTPGGVYRSIPFLHTGGDRNTPGGGSRGISSDEYLAILKRGEFVSNPKGQGAAAKDGGGIEVNVFNSTSEPASAQVDQQTDVNGMRKVSIFLGNDVTKNGPQAQAMQSTFGLRRRPRLS